MPWYSGRSIRSCLFLWSVCAISEQPHRMWDAVSLSLEHTRQLISSTFSCNFSSLYILALINCCLMDVSTDRTISVVVVIGIIICSIKTYRCKKPMASIGRPA